MLKQLDNRQRCVVCVLVEMLAPYKGRVYDLCCASAGIVVQCETVVEEYGGRIGDSAVYGQESNSPFNDSGWFRKDDDRMPNL